MLRCSRYEVSVIVVSVLEELGLDVKAFIY